MTDLYDLSKLPKLDKDGCFKSGEFFIKITNYTSFCDISVYHNKEAFSLCRASFCKEAEEEAFLDDITDMCMCGINVKLARQRAEAMLELLHIIEQLKA